MSEIEVTAAQASSAGVSRRSLLKAVAAGGALMGTVDLSRAAGAARPGAATQAASPSAELNAVVQVGPGERITLVMPRVEMGQGVYTALPQLIAEELEVDPRRVTLSHAPADDSRYANPGLGLQVTGGSTSLATAWMPMRQAGAAARMMLVQAAAEVWGVPASSCRAEDGQVLHPASGRRSSYGTLAPLAAGQAVPAQLQLKDPRDFRYIGAPQLRLDAPAKVDGTAQFGIDVRLPGLLIAAVAASPHFGGKVRSVDVGAARKVRGVRQVVNLGDLIAVLADHTGAARKGLAAAKIEWDKGPAADYSTETMTAELARASLGDGATARSEGDVAAAARAAGARTLEAVYQQPLMAHAAMEPMNCTVRLSSDRCEIWTGTQVPTLVQAAAAREAGMKPEQVVVNNQYLGGGFGRRLEADIAAQAVRIARHSKAPVKVIWSREEDIQHDAYRPYHYNRLSASLDAQGLPTAWRHRVTGSSVMARFAPAAYKNDVDADAIRDASGPYHFPNVLIQYVRQEPPPGLMTGWWRGVGHVQNAFPVECFIDELAHASGQDPLQLRLRMLDKHPRARRVLELLAEKSQWGRSMPPRHGRGLALTQAFGTYAAQVTEVVVDDGSVRPTRVVTVVDCGLVVTPSTVEAQVQGGTVFGLSAVLFGNITVREGRIEQSNFHDFRVMRMNEVPAMETHVVSSAEAPTGIGEVATVLVAPSVVNAVFAATGQRVRKLPIDSESLRVS